MLILICEKVHENKECSVADEVAGIYYATRIGTCCSSFCNFDVKRDFFLKSWFNKLYAKTIEVAKLYTGTFIVVMILNQLIFFGFCLNPICLVAAMPHVLLITVIVGTYINKVSNDEKTNFVDPKKNVTQPKAPPTVIPNVIAENERHIPPKPVRPGYDINKYKPPSQTPVLCPLCQSEMIIRTARNGRYAGNQFYGCSQFPRCKGIINL